MGGVGSGKKPRSTHLRALEGVREDRLNRDEPLPSDGIIVPPVELPEDAQAVWNRLAPDLIAKRVMTTWDADAFSFYCRAVAMANHFADEVACKGSSVDRPYRGETVSPAMRSLVAAEKMMSSIGSRFGLTPGDRAALKVGDDGGKQNAAAYIV